MPTRVSLISKDGQAYRAVSFCASQSWNSILNPTKVCRNKSGTVTTSWNVVKSLLQSSCYKLQVMCAKNCQIWLWSFKDKRKNVHWPHFFDHHHHHHHHHHQNSSSIANIYRSPNSILADNIKLCHEIEGLVNEVKMGIIIIGDFNFPDIDWDIYYSTTNSYINVKKPSVL